MPKPKVSLSAAARLKPKEAIAYFESKGYKITFDWWEIEARAHAQAFTVAHAAKLDVLETIRHETQKIFNDGLTERQFIKALEPRLKAKGWWGKQILVDKHGTAKPVQLGSPWRLKTIYRTNKRVAYNAAIHAQQKDRAASRPYWMYVAIDDSKTRPRHAALNSKVFRHDDPIWEAIYPPNGWGCRCRVRDLSAAKLKRLGLDVESSDGKLFDIDQRLGVDKFTGEEIRRAGKEYRFTGPDGKPTTFAPDPGWSHNPAAQTANLSNHLIDKLERTTPKIAQAAINDIVSAPQFTRWLKSPKGQLPVALLDDTLAKQISSKQHVASLSAETLAKQRQRHPELTPEEYLAIPDIIKNGQAIKDTDKSLVFVRHIDRRYTAVIKATQTGAGLYITSFRRLDKEQEIERLLRKGEELRKETDAE